MDALGHAVCNRQRGLLVPVELSKYSVDRVLLDVDVVHQWLPRHPKLLVA